MLFVLDTGVSIVSDGGEEQRGGNDGRCVGMKKYIAIVCWCMGCGNRNWDLDICFCVIVSSCVHGLL